METISKRVSGVGSKPNQGSPKNASNPVSQSLNLQNMNKIIQNQNNYGDENIFALAESAGRVVTYDQEHHNSSSLPPLKNASRQE